MSEYIHKPPKSLHPGAVVITYLRDSGGPNQEESIGQQERAIKSFCKEYGLILQKVYADTGSGRRTKKREQFKQMFNDVMNTPADLRPAGLLLWSYSRFSRDILDFNYFLYGMLRQGLAVHSLTEEIPEGLAGGVLLSVKAYSNADFSEQLGKNIKRGIADRVKAGYNNGGQAPRGYLVVREEQENTRQNGLKRIGIKWKPDPDLAPLVVLAWEMRAQGKSYAEITKATGGKIYTTRNSWFSHFKNKSYLGIGKAGSLEIPDHHTPLITAELWDAVQRVQASMPRHGISGDPTHPRRTSHPSLLSGLSFCVHCDAAMILHTSKDYRSYRCGTRDRKRGYADCTQAQGVNARLADKVILNAVLNQILTPPFIEDILVEIQNQFADTSKLDREIDRVDNLLIKTDRSISRLLMLAEAAGEIKEIAVRLKELQREKAEHNAELRSLQAERAFELPEITPEALGMIFARQREKIEAATQDGDVLTAKRHLAYFVDKIELGREKSLIHYSYPIPSEESGALCAHKST